jgi:predicted ribosomally synthesized peptide with SipW-like signal peptide
MNRKIMFSLVIIVMALALVIGGTFAWFTAMTEGPVNEFVAGTVEIDADFAEVVDILMFWIT